MDNVKKLKGFVTENEELYYKTPGETVGINGESYNLLNFVFPYHYNLDKIAHSLAHQARYIGNCNGFYSIAQHSWYIAHHFLLRGEPEKAKQGLGHDMGEAFISDVSMPLKKLIQKDSQIFSVIEPEIERVIAEKFGFKYPYDEDVMAVDKNIAIWELENMMKNDFFSDYWSPEKAKKMFLEMYRMIENHQVYYTKK